MTVARLKKIQATREKLYSEITAHADIEDKSGDEWDKKWKELNTAYDENDTERQALNQQLAQAQIITNRIKHLESGFDPNSQNFIGRDGASLDNGPSNPLFQATSMDFAGRQALAMQGWMLNRFSGNLADQVTDEHRQAAQTIGMSLNADEINLRLSPTNDFLYLQAQKQTMNQKTSLLRSALNAMTTGLGTTGGFLVGETFLRTIEQAMLDFSGVLQVADIMRTATGEPLNWPTMDDTGNTGAIVGEAEDASTATDTTLGQQTWHAHIFTSKQIYVTRSLLQDSLIDLVRVIGEMLGTRLGRIQNTRYTTGIGGGTQPRGIVVASALGVTTAAAGAIIFDEIIDLEHSIDPSRRNGAAYMFHDGILQVIRKLKDGNSQYLWSRGTDAGAPDRLNGWPYFMNQDMQSTVATATKTILFGQLSQYKIRQVTDMRLQRLIEVRAAFDQDAFIAYLRGDGNLLNAGDNPVKHLLQA